MPNTHANLNDFSFCERLQKATQPVWESEKSHPFVQGLGDGTLPADCFRFYLIQDYLFLINYAKVFAQGVIKASNVVDMQYLATLCADTLNGEMGLHRSYCAEFDIDAKTLENAPLALTTNGYSGHLMQAATCGDLTSIITAILPCQWGYHQMATHLLSQGASLTQGPYCRWIAMYASDEFAEYGLWLRTILESLVKGLDEPARQRLCDLFAISSRWELLFWEMAWRQDMTLMQPL